MERRKERREWQDWSNVLGIQTFANGEKYEGEWKEGKMHGKGLLIHHHRHLLL